MATYEERIGKAITHSLLFMLTLLVSGIVNLLIAFPVKWAWNYVMPYIFNLPTINWLHAFCLLFVLAGLWKLTIVDINKK